MDTTIDNEIKTVLEKIDAAALLPDDSVRNVTKLDLGKCVRQGDVYVFAIDSTARLGKKRGSRQVAVGATIGARHVAEGQGVEVFDSAGYSPNGQTLPDFAVGPIVKAEKRWSLTHPEHADVCLPAGHYQVIYQQDPIRNAAVAD